MLFGIGTCGDGDAKRLVALGAPLVMQSFKIDSDCDVVSPLRGKPPLIGYAIDSDYWHLELFLRFEDGSLLRFYTNEHCLAPLFDCYTISVQPVSACNKSFAEISPSFMIDSAFALLRAEWLQVAPDLEDVTFGNNPHTQHSGLPGTVPDVATVSAVVQAGVLMGSNDSRQIAIVASDTAPLNVDFIAGDADIQELLKRHELVRCD